MHRVRSRAPHLLFLKAHQMKFFTVFMLGASAWCPALSLVIPAAGQAWRAANRLFTVAL
jgi:hypothetical protein